MTSLLVTMGDVTLSNDFSRSQMHEAKIFKGFWSKGDQASRTFCWLLGYLHFFLFYSFSLLLVLRSLLNFIFSTWERTQGLLHTRKALSYWAQGLPTMFEFITALWLINSCDISFHWVSLLKGSWVGEWVSGFTIQLICLPTKAAGSWRGIGWTLPGYSHLLSFIAKEDIANGGTLM